MARNQQKADEIATYYRITKKLIAKQKEEEKKLLEMWRAKKDPAIRLAYKKIRHSISFNEKNLNRFAHRIVEYLYGEEEKQDEQ